MKSIRERNSLVRVLVAAMLAGIFAIDMSVPLGFAGGVPYVLPILVCTWSSRRRDIVLTAMIGSGLTIVGYLTSPDGGIPLIVLANRALALLAIWTAALLTYRESVAKEALSASNDRLNIELVGIQDLHERAEAQASEAVALAEDLSAAREAAERATARAEADERRIRSILDTVTDAIITIDERGIIESFNPAAETMFGYTSEEAVGRNVSMLVAEPHRSRHDDYLARYNAEPSRIAGTVSEQIAVKRNGAPFPIEISINPMWIGDQMMFTGVVRDITDRKRAEEEIRRLALTDALTGLANRNRFDERFTEALSLARRQKHKVAVLLIDLDKFKPINDTYGHPVGDEVLKQVADRITEQCRETDTAARLGGDEFAVLVRDVPDRAAASNPARHLTESLSAPMVVGGHTVQISASVGISMFPDDGDEPEELVRKADLALYQAKLNGRNGYHFFDPEVAEDCATPAVLVPEI